MKMKLPELKLTEVRQLFRKWLSTRKTATAAAREMWKLTGKLRNAAKVMRPSRFFVWRLLLMVRLEGQQDSGDS